MDLDLQYRNFRIRPPVEEKDGNAAASYTQHGPQRRLRVR